METQPRWEFLTYLVCSTGQFRYREGDGVIMVQLCLLLGCAAAVTNCAVQLTPHTVIL